MKTVVTAKQARDFDNHVINELGVPGILLMEDAAHAVTDAVLQQSGNVFILCGTGNNGGDGLAVLRQLVMHKRNAIAVIIGDADRLRGDAHINYDAAMAQNCSVFSASDTSELDAIAGEYGCDIIIDALFGTGLDRDVEGAYADVIGWANTKPAYRIAIDLPSGINADNGMVMGCAFMADETVTFQSIKRGHLLFPGRGFCGRVSVSPVACGDIDTDEFVTELSDLREIFYYRFPDSYKGTYGKVLIIGGAPEYAGAAVLTALAAQRIGAGLVKVICSGQTKAALLSAAPEVMACAVEGFNTDIPNLTDHIKWADVIAVGMGAGKDAGLPALMEMLLSSKKSIVIDADGLNCIANNPYLLDKLHEKCVLTPHIGEFSRMTGLSFEKINSDPAKCAREFAQKYGVTLLLKSATSITATPQGRLYYNTAGNSGLAKGGSGDTLSGLIAGLLAQRMELPNAVYIAAHFQGLAAEIADMPEQVMAATDVSKAYAEVIKMIAD